MIIKDPFIKHPMIKEEAAVTCLKYMMCKYALAEFGIYFCLGLQLPPSDIITFLHMNFPSVSTTRELFWSWLTTDSWLTTLQLL